MYCIKCGAEVKKGSRNCPNCGAKIKQRFPEKLFVSDKIKQKLPKELFALDNIKQKFPQKLFMSGRIWIDVVLFFIAIILLFTLKKSTLVPENYISYEVTGFSTEGTVSLTFDCQKMISDIKKKKKLTEQQENAIYAKMKGAAQQFKISPNGTLANGDKFTVKSQLSGDLLKKYGFVLKSKAVTNTVDGLFEITTIKLINYVNIGFEGFEGNGIITVDRDIERLKEDVTEAILKVDNSNAAKNYVSKDLENYLNRNFNMYYAFGMNLKTGDEETIEIKMQNPQITEYGIHFKTGTYKITVSNLAPIEQIALKDYITVSFEGYDSNAMPQISLDESRLTQDLKEMFQRDNRNCYGLNGEDVNLSDDEWSDTAAAATERIQNAWQRYCTVEASPNGGISEGDMVSITSSAYAYVNNPIYIDDCGIYIDGDFEFEVKAENLNPLTHIDLADDVTVTFSGICPKVYAEITIKKDQPYSSDINFFYLDSEWIRSELGDRYEKEISYDEKAVKKDGYIVDNATIQYTIEGLPTYNFTFEDLSAATLEELEKESERAAWEAVTADISWTEKQLGMSSGWFLVNQGTSSLKSGAKWYNQSRFYYTYYKYSGLALLWTLDLPVQYVNGSTAHWTVWYGEIFYNVVEDTDGNLTAEKSDGKLFFTEDSVGEWIAQQKDDFSDDMQEIVLEAPETELQQNEIVVQTAQPLELEASAQETMHKLLSQTSPELPQDLSQAVANTYNGHTYARFDEVMTWEEAEAFCEKEGGHLATITSREEQLAIAQMFSDAPYSAYWLGATDKEWEGAWKWVTGEPFSWTDWYDNQPNNDNQNEFEEENYLTIVPNWNTQWNDAPNGEAYGFILELDPSEEVEGQTMLTALVASDSSQAGVSDAFSDPYGGTHYNSVYLDASEYGWVSYQLDGKWDVFGANLSTYTDASSGISIDIAIWGDGRLLYLERGYQKTDAPKEIILSVAGVQNLSIMSYNRGEYSGGIVYLNEARLLAAASEVQSDMVLVELKDQPMVASGECKTYSELFADGYGNLRKNGIRLDGASNRSIVWNLDGAYMEVSGVLTLGMEANGTVDIQILADGECIFELEELDKIEGPQTFVADVTGKQILELKTITKETTSNANVYITDAYLKGIKKEMSENSIETMARQFDCAQELKENAVKMVTMGDYCYYRIDEAMMLADARKYSEQMGGELAVVHTSAEQLALNTLLSGGVNSQYWLGGYCSGNDWYWLDESKVDYTNWSYGKPDNDNNEKNALTAFQDGTWNNANDENEFGFVVRVKATGASDGGVNLTDLEWSDSYSAEVRTMLDRTGCYHSDGVLFDTSAQGWMRVTLDGAYSKLQASVQAQRSAAASERMTLAFFGDGRFLGAVENCAKADGATPILVDVSGVSVLTIVSRNSMSTDNAGLILNEAVLYQAVEKMDKSITRLSELLIVDSKGMESGVGCITDARNHLYGDYSRFDSTIPSYVMYNLNGNFSTFSGTFMVRSSAILDGTADIAIYVDGNLVYEKKQMTKLEESDSFSVDVSGARTLQITVQTSSEHSGVWVYLEADQLV
jgi:hypothetical protein